YIHDTNTFLVYDSEDKLISRIDDAWSNSLDRNESSSFFPTDFIITRGFRFAAVDPWRACISLWDRSLRQLNPIALDYDIEIRPVSICNGGDNSLFFINSSDNRVWELDRSMDVKPMTYLSSKLPTKNKYIQVRYLVNRNEVILLGSETLEKITLPGNFVKKHDVKSLSPKRFALFGDEIWILGNRIECVNVINLERLYISSIKNEFESITDIIVPYKEILYLLQNRGNYITRMKIVRNSDH
ncbi:hypothetical protein H8D57_02515, partial [bacterium]|nr:hypothetical protein [bacterium]